MRLPLSLVALAGLLPALALADDERRWSGTAELGLAIASGNADSETMNGKLSFHRQEERWFYEVDAAALRAKSDARLSANRQQLGGKLGYDLSDRAYTFGSMRYDHDDFASFESQLIASAGVGYRFIERGHTSLVGEFGPGTRRWQPVDQRHGTPPLRVSFATETDTIARGSLEFKHRLTENTTLGNLLLAESGGGSTFLQNDLGVTAQMSSRLALKAGYQVRHTTDVPEGLEKTDTLFTTNLVVGF